MSRKTAKADVIPVRQANQYNCMTTSLSMALRALGVSEDECSPQQVNKVVGAMPLRGAAWEPLLAAANHYGMRATLTLPSTVRQLKQWTDAGTPVVIAWNPEGREWSHASLVFDVDDDLNVYVADPNIPDPDETVRVVPKAEFYGKWYEKAAQGFLIRRPACAIEREITPDGRQVMASQKKASRWGYDDPNFQVRIDKALEESTDLQEKWPSTPAKEYAEYQRRRKKHPNDVAYEKAHAKIWEKHLRGTGWTEDEWEAELEKRMDSRMDSRRRTAGVTNGFMDMESYEVDGTGRKKLSLTPITYTYDAWEYIGEDGGVEVSWGSEKALMDRREFATFAADMKKALNWASHYDYSKTASAKRVVARKTASRGRVALMYAAKIAAGERLDRSLRQKINKAMERKGLDGNGRFRKPEEGYSRAVEVMQDHGIELDEVVSSHLFNPRPSGTVKADIALTNEADRFSPVSITNSMLYLQYTEVSDDRFEVVAYLS